MSNTWSSDILSFIQSRLLVAPISQTSRSRPPQKITSLTIPMQNLTGVSNMPPKKCHGIWFARKSGLNAKNIFQLYCTLSQNTYIFFLEPTRTKIQRGIRILYQPFSTDNSSQTRKCSAKQTLNRGNFLLISLWHPINMPKTK